MGNRIGDSLFFLFHLVSTYRHFAYHQEKAYSAISALSTEKMKKFSKKHGKEVQQFDFIGTFCLYRNVKLSKIHLREGRMRLNVEMTKEVYDEFSKYCAVEGRSMSAVIRGLVIGWNKEKMTDEWQRLQMSQMNEVKGAK